MNPKIMMRGKWKRVSPWGIRLVDGGNRMNIMVVNWVFIVSYVAIEKMTNRII